MCRKLFLLVSFVLVLGLVGNAWAEIYSKDVGGPALLGSYSEVSGDWIVEGDGDGIGGTSDQFHYVYQIMDGNCVLEVNLTGLAPGATAGVMIRGTLDGDSKHAMMAATLGSIMFQWRWVDGGDSSASTSSIAPEALRITRQGDVLKGEYLYYGYWVALAQVTIPMDACVNIGLVVTSNSSSALSTAVFRDVAWTGTPCALPREALEPSPMDRAEAVPINPILTWEPGEGAIYHLVSFSDNYDDVNDIAVLEAVAGTSYDPGILNLTETYYWAVHTMWQDGTDMGLAMGDIWSFTITDHILVEDFEPYNVPPEAIDVQHVTEANYIAVRAVPPDDVNLVAYWPLDDDFNDYSGSGFDGDPNGASFIPDDPVRGAVAAFDGDDYVDCGNPAELNFGTGDWSVAVWIKTTESDKGCPFANGGDGGGGHRYTLGVGEHGDDKITLTTDDDADKGQADTSTNVTDDAWHHVIGVREGGNIKIYLDGILEETIGLPDGYDLSGTVQYNVYLGCITHHDDEDPYLEKFYTGLLDDVRIYDCALTEGNARYMSGLGNVEIPARWGPMIAHYTFDADDANDSSGNNRHGVERDGPSYVDGYIGKAIEFDGGQDVAITGFIEIQDTDELSICMWAKPDVVTDQHFMWFTHESTGNSKIRCYVKDGTWRWKHGDGSKNIEIRADATAGVWTHYAGVRRNGDKLYLYIDGVLEDQASFSGPSGQQSNSWIGSEDGGNKFDGCIDDVRIYDIALSHGQVVELAVDGPNPMADTWTDSGEVVSSLETWGAQQGHQAMRIDCNGVGEVRRLSPFEDWTLANIKAVVLYMKGDPDNVIDDLYMGLTSAVGKPRTSYLSYDGDINDVMSSDWHEWNVDLEAMAAGAGDTGVPLPHIEEIAFGASGTGTLCFDYLTLWTTRCVPKYGPYADITDDCVVDGKDLKILADDWLKSDSAIYPVPPPAQVVVEPGYTVVATPPPAQTVIGGGYTIPGYTIVAVAPDDTHLVAHYEFEGDANDSTANANHGTVHGDPVYVAGMVGDAIACDATDDYNDYVIVPDSASLSFGTGSFSISCWIKSSWSGGDKEFIVKNGSAGSEFGGKPPDGPHSGKRYVLKFDGDFRLAIDDDDDKTVCGADPSKFATGDWVQVTAVRDRDADKLYIYADGELVGEQEDVTDLSIDSPGELMSIAAAQKEDGEYAGEIGHWFTGQLDDMRFYNDALSEGNARFLAGVGDKVVDPVVVPAIYGPLLVSYSFDANDANDDSGNERHAIEENGPSYADGILGRALKLDGNGDHVADDDAGDYMNGLGEMTISLWIKSDKTDTDKGFIMADDYSWSDRRGVRYDKKGGDSKELKNIIKYGFATDEGREEDESYGEVQTKDWQHLAFAWKSGVGIKLYVDGVLDIPGYNNPPKDGVTEGYTKLMIGKGSKDKSSDASWDGLIDEVRIYNCTLSYGEVRYLAGKLDDLEIPTVYSPMIAGYNFDTDDDASDISGNGIHGTLAGDASVSGGVLHLDGDDDCVDIGHSARFNPESGPFSISVWINIEQWKNDWAGIVTKRGEDSRGWQLRRSGGGDKLCFTVRGTSADDDMHGNIAPTLGEWHHVAAIWDPDAEKRTLYLDGQLDKQWNDSGTVRWMGHNVYIGARARKDNRIWKGIDAEFKGMIDDVQIYDHALSYLEMMYIATRGATRVYYPLVSGADLFEDEPEESRYVNFKDYAVMADQWLLEMLWP